MGERAVLLLLLLGACCFLLLATGGRMGVGLAGACCCCWAALLDGTCATWKFHLGLAAAGAGRLALACCRCFGRGACCCSSGRTSNGNPTRHCCCWGRVVHVRVLPRRHVLLLRGCVVRSTRHFFASRSPILRVWNVVLCAAPSFLPHRFRALALCALVVARNRLCAPLLRNLSYAPLLGWNLDVCGVRQLYGESLAR